MEFWQPIIIAAVPTAGAVLAVWASTRDLRLRRRMETVDRFLKIAATSQARGRESSKVGSSEQVAAIHLLAELGVSERELAGASHASLSETIRWSEPRTPERDDSPSDQDIVAALREAAPDVEVDDAAIAKVRDGIRRVQERGDPTLTQINKNAKIALARVEKSKNFRKLNSK